MISLVAAQLRRHLRTPRGSLCHRYPACASFPPTGPALVGTRFSGASPGIRVSRSGLRRDVQTSRASDNKKPSGALGSGGFAATGLMSVRLCEIAPKGQPCAIDWRRASRESDEVFVPVVHEKTRVVRERDVREGAGHTPAICWCQGDECVKIVTVGEIIENILWVCCRVWFSLMKLLVLAYRWTSLKSSAAHGRH